MALAELDVVGSAGVLISGSVIAISEARSLLVREEPRLFRRRARTSTTGWTSPIPRTGRDRPGLAVISLSAGNPMRVVLMTVLIFEIVVFGLAIPVMILISGVPQQRPLHLEVARRCSPCSPLVSFDLESVTSSAGSPNSPVSLSDS